MSTHRTTGSRGIPPRRAASVAIVAVVTLLLAACGSTGAGTTSDTSNAGGGSSSSTSNAVVGSSTSASNASAMSDTSSSAATASDTAGATAGGSTSAASVFPVAVQNRYGTTTVPDRPQRVVSLGFKAQDWLYAFGVQPVAVRAWYGLYPNEINPWDKPFATGEPPELLTDISYEKIAALRPDLIVAVYSGITEEQYDKLSRIAPTVAQPVDSTNYNVAWRDMTRIIGTAVGEADRAAEMITWIEGLFEQAKQEHPDLVGKEAIVAPAFSTDTIGVYTSGDPRSKFLSELGLQVPDKIDEMAEPDSFKLNVSPELVADTFDLAKDAVVVIGAPSADQAGAQVALKKSTFGDSLVSKQGRAIFFDSAVSDVAFSFDSPLSIPFTLSHLVPQLVAAIDGDPGTTVPATPQTFEEQSVSYPAFIG